MNRPQIDDMDPAWARRAAERAARRPPAPQHLGYVVQCPVCQGPAKPLGRGVLVWLGVFLLFPLGLLLLLDPRKCRCARCGSTFKTRAI